MMEKIQDALLYVHLHLLFGQFDEKCPDFFTLCNDALNIFSSSFAEYWAIWTAICKHNW